jgi:hypothetical protein
MTPGEYECPDCGDPRVALSPGADGGLLASCQGCGRAHGLWRECLAEAAATAKTPKRTFFAGWFLRGAAR